MKNFWLRISPKITLTILIVATTFAAIWFFVLPKTVAVVLDGDIQVVTTRALFVRGALKAGGIDPAEVSLVLPEANSWLENEEVIQVYHAFEVHIWEGETEHFLHSVDRLPGNWLDTLGLVLDKQDQLRYRGTKIEPDQVLDPAGYYELQLLHPVSIQLTIDGELIKFQTTATTLGEALAQEQIQLREADVLVPVAETSLQDKTTLQVTLQQAKAITIKADGDTIEIYSSAKTVGFALAEAGISLQNLDYSKPKASARIPENGNIRVVRVHEELVLTQELLAFATLNQPLPEVPIDTFQIVQVGEYGVEAQRIRVHYEDGAEISRVLEDAWVAREPVPRIEGYGTKIEIKTIDTADGSIQYWRALEFYATSYSPSRSGTSPDVPWYGHVFCGGLLENGFVGVDLDYVPCGTRLYIPGYGFAVAMDTGRITGAWVDLGYLDDDYVTWHQFVTVYFLAPAPPLEEIRWNIPPGSFY